MDLRGGLRAGGAATEKYPRPSGGASAHTAPPRPRPAADSHPAPRGRTHARPRPGGRADGTHPPAAANRAAPTHAVPCRPAAGAPPRARRQTLPPPPLSPLASCSSSRVGHWSDWVVFGTRRARCSLAPLAVDPTRRRRHLRAPPLSGWPLAGVATSARCPPVRLRGPACPVGSLTVQLWTDWRGSQVCK